MRTATEPLVLVKSLRESVKAVDKGQPISDILALAQRIDDEEAPFKIFSQFTEFFALLALFLAATGIYGVMAYLVENRSHEIGIRMVCGATPKTILWLVLSGNLKLILTGISIGLVLSWRVAGLLQSMLYRVTANDPFTYISAVVVICAAVLLGSFVPLRKASKLDPMIVLRYE